MDNSEMHEAIDHIKDDTDNTVDDNDPNDRLETVTAETGWSGLVVTGCEVGQVKHVLVSNVTPGIWRSQLPY